MEDLDFGVTPMRSLTSRVAVLVNYSSDWVLSYKWVLRSLFRSAKELRIEPEEGQLAPNDNQLILFTLQGMSGALSIAGEVACEIGWTHISEFQNQDSENVGAWGNGLPGPGREGGDKKEEVIVEHIDHRHEPGYSKRDFVSLDHVSVCNRLTVSRFRNLMSTAAGQRFLNENLHRTALLSSHMPPRRVHATAPALALSPQGTSAGGSLPGSGPKPPSTFPLFVRVHATVIPQGFGTGERSLVVPEAFPRREELEEVQLQPATMEEI